MTRPRITTSISFKPMVPDVPQVAKVMTRSNALSGLMQRLRLSQDCLAAIRMVLPPAMAPYVSAGPVDDEGWTLLAANSAVSAKLRQLQPRLMEALVRKGIKVNTIRVRIQNQ